MLNTTSSYFYDESINTAREQLLASLALIDESTISENESKNSSEDNLTPTSPKDAGFKDSNKLAVGGDSLLNQGEVDLHWEIVNVSAGGYCLRWNSDETSKAQIGELIALREREANGTYQWRVGAIRWMQYTREFGLEIGVQLLSPNVCPATIKRKNSPSNTIDNCIMLPGINPLKLPATLLLPTQSFRLNDCLEFKALGQIMELKLSGIKEKTGSFTQFIFTKTDTEIKLQSTDRKLSQKETDDFAEIWSSL